MNMNRQAHICQNEIAGFPETNQVNFLSFGMKGPQLFLNTVNQDISLFSETFSTKIFSMF